MMSSWKVTVDESKVTVFGGGREEPMVWSSIKGIALEVKPGSYGSDIYWHVLGAEGGLIFPMEAEGLAEALRFFQTLPGFDNEKVIAAIQSSEEKLFMLWSTESTR